jgi:chromosome segregation ATPase
MSDSDAPEHDDGASLDLAPTAPPGGAGDAMDPDHPLLARAQLALKKQLLNTQREIDAKIRKREEHAAREKKHREDVGVELYAAQQTLSRLQLSLQSMEDEKSRVSNRRSEIESDLERLREWHETRSRDADRRKLAAETKQMELEKLNATLRRLEADARSLRTETGETRRQALAAEKETKFLEKTKLEQDVLIDSLHETLKEAQEKSALYEAQRHAQVKETKRAGQMLTEANAEIDSVTLEKKRLTSAWRSALVGDAKRDEALRATREALERQRQEVLLIEAETASKKTQAKEASKTNERLVSALRESETEASRVERLLRKVSEKKEKLAETHARLVSTQETTERELSNASKETAGLMASLRVTEEAARDAARALRDLDEKMVSNLSSQAATEKDARRVLEATKHIRKRIAEEERNTIGLQNAIAKCRVEVVHRASLVEESEESLKALGEVTSEKTRALDAYEAEVSAREEALAKRGFEVTRLNEALESKRAASRGGGSDSNLGPLEANVKRLSDETERKEREVKALRRRWVEYQTELVALVRENTDAGEKMRRLKAEVTVHVRRKNRLSDLLDREREEIRALESATERARRDRNALDAASALRDERSRTVSTDVAVAETEIVGRLKAMEADASKLESRVVAAAASKKRAVAEVIEAERQILLWERKIQIEKETQAAIDPNVGERSEERRVGKEC